MDPNFLNLAIGLLILIVANIVLGSSDAIFNQKFDTVKFFKGIGKGILVSGSMVGLYFAGTLNPEIIAIDVGGQQLTILSAINMVVLGGYYIYARQVFEKLAGILGTKKIED